MKYFKKFESFKPDNDYIRIIESLRLEEENLLLLNESLEQAKQYITDNKIDLGMEFKKPKTLLAAETEKNTLSQKVNSLKPKGKPTPEQIEELKAASQELNVAKEKQKKIETKFREDFNSKMANPNRKAFEYIKNMLGSTPGMIGQFVKFHFGDEKVPLTSELDNTAEGYGTSLTGFYNYYKSNKAKLEKYLPRRISEYEKFEYIGDDIASSSKESTIDKLLKNFDAQERRKFVNLTDDQKRILNKLADLPKEYISRSYSLPEDDLVIQKLKAFPWSHFMETERDGVVYYPNSDVYTIIDTMEDHVENSLNRINGSDIIDYKTQTHNMLYDGYSGKFEIVLDVNHKKNNNNYLLIKTYDKGLLDNNDLSSYNWCINRLQSSYYDDYSNPLYGFTQYILYNFNEKPKEKHAMYGISIDKNDDIPNGACQDYDNKPVPGELSFFKTTYGIDSDVFDASYKDMPKYRSMVDGVTSYQDLKNTIVDIDKNENKKTANQLKSLIINNFDTKKFLLNVITNVENWNTLLTQINLVKTEQAGFYSDIRNSLNRDDLLDRQEMSRLFDGYGLDNSDMSIDQIKEKFPIVKELNILMFSLYLNSDLDKIIENVRPMNHKRFISKIVENLNPPSKETLYKAVEYFKHDKDALDLFLKEFNDSLTENQDNRNILNSIIADKNNYSNLYEYIKENKLIVAMLDKIPGFSSNFLTNQNIDFLIDFTISLSKYSDGQINGMKTIDNLNDEYYHRSLILAFVDIIINSEETPELASEKLNQFEVIKSTNYQPDNFKFALFQKEILEDTDLDIDLLMRIIALFESNTE